MHSILTNTVYLDMNVPKWTKDNCTTIEVNIKTDCPSGIWHSCTHLLERKKKEYIFVANKVELFNYDRFYFIQDVARVYHQRKDQVYVTLVESNQILSSFDESLRKYAENKIKQRERFQLVKSSVTRNFSLTVFLNIHVHCIYMYKLLLCIPYSSVCTFNISWPFKVRTVLTLTVI